MRRLAKAFFGMLFIPAFLVSCSDCDDCGENKTWVGEYRIINASKYNVELVINTQIDDPKEESVFIAPSDSLVVIRKEDGIGCFYERPFLMVNRIIFEGKWINELDISNRFNINYDSNYKRILFSEDYRTSRYVITDNDQLYIATENSQKHRYCIINNSGCDVKVVSSKDSVFIANNDSIVIVKEKNPGEYRNPFYSEDAKFTFGNFTPQSYLLLCKFNFSDRANYEVLSYDDTLASFRYVITEQDSIHAANPYSHVW